MEWYYILMIVLGGLIVIAGIIFLVLYLSNKNKKKENKVNEDAILDKLVNLLGSYSNINDVSVNSSRLSISLNNYDVLESNEFKEFVNEKGIGILKSSKKVTLVIGDLANKYYKIMSSNIK